jgi:uncharacterized protein YxjI
MQFPLRISFRLLTFIPQLDVRDAAGASIGHVRQKLLALKEDVTVYSDDTLARPIYTIRADRIIDFTANYAFADAQGRPLGRVRRQGMRSLWRAHYLIGFGEAPVFEVHEESAWVRLADSIVGQIPLLGALSGYFFNPKYLVSRSDGSAVLRMTKRPALFETDFEIEQLGPILPEEQVVALLGLMMIILLERSRG